MPRSLVVHYTHAIHPSTVREVARLRAELGPDHAIAVTGCCEHETVLDPLRADPILVVCTTRDDLRALPYPARLQAARWKTLRGNNDLALLRLFRLLPDYDFYWFIEHDVRYTGHWRNLLEAIRSRPARHPYLPPGCA